MPIPSPFHPRTQAACVSLRFKDWAGYYAVCAYDTYVEREYFAFRHAAGIIDVTPLYKYEVRGPDAEALLCRVMARNIAKLKVGQVAYGCWCDDDGKLLDDGTVSRLDEQAYRVTAAEPSLAWFCTNSGDLDVTIEDSTDRIAALSVQGPCARDLLTQCCDAPLDNLRFFRLTRATLDGADVVITRTGYTGDLGYEIWADAGDALRVWDAVMDAGRPLGALPAGLDAMDITRIEAGFVMNGVDYHSANHCLIESRKSTPYEAGLGWTVHLDREPFIGQTALRHEKHNGPARRLAGLVMDWDEFEALFARYNLPPEVCTSAWRTSIPIYNRDGRQVGYATSGAWSPTLKQNLVLATLDAPHGQPGEWLRMEVTVEHTRHQVGVVVTDRPFFDPPRKRS